MPKKAKLEVPKVKLISWNYAHITTADEDNFEPEPYWPEVVNIVKKSIQASRSV